MEENELVPIKNILDALRVRNIRNECRGYMTNDPSSISVFRQMRWYYGLYKPEHSKENLTCFLFTTGGKNCGFGLVRKKSGKYLITGGLTSSERGKGLGKVLFMKLIDAVPSQEVWLDVLSSNIVAKKLYTELGFREVKKTKTKGNIIINMVKTKMKKKQFNYENKTYLNKLNALQESFYSKYVRTVNKYANSKQIKFLDVGCGNGTVLKLLEAEGFNKLYGVDISELFVKSAAKKGLKNVLHYDGETLPFKNSFFDIIGSFNVLEHTQDPEQYLEEEIQKLKKGGFLIVACPNFFTPILKTSHRRIHGFKNRILNTCRILMRSFTGGRSRFERIEPVVKENFEYDDDSIVVTNPIDLKKILRDKNCSIVYESGFINTDSFISRMIDRLPILIYMMPSCFMVAQKNKE